MSKTTGTTRCEGPTPISLIVFQLESEPTNAFERFHVDLAGFACAHSRAERSRPIVLEVRLVVSSAVHRVRPGFDAGKPNRFRSFLPLRISKNIFSGITTHRANHELSR